MKIFVSEFWIGGAGNRQLKEKLRLKAPSIEEFRKGLKFETTLVDGSPVPAAMTVEIDLLVISREVPPTAEELQSELPLE